MSASSPSASSVLFSHGPLLPTREDGRSDVMARFRRELTRTKGGESVFANLFRPMYSGTPVDRSKQQQRRAVVAFNTFWLRGVITLRMHPCRCPQISVQLKSQNAETPGQTDKHRGMNPLHHTVARECTISEMSVSKDCLHSCKSDPQASLFSSPSDMHDPQYRVMEEELAHLWQFLERDWFCHGTSTADFSSVLFVLCGRKAYGQPQTAVGITIACHRRRISP